MSKKNKDKKDKSGGTAYTYHTPSCHTKNYAVHTEPGGGTLYCNGWSKDYAFDANTVVIDLTGERKPNLFQTLLGKQIFKRLKTNLPPTFYDWIAIPIKDYGIPMGMTTKIWMDITKDIRDILKAGHDVLVCCQGGHGRTGMFVSIVGYYLKPDDEQWQTNPVSTVRIKYCVEAVDTKEQEQYVYSILGLDLVPDPAWYKPAYTSFTPSPSNNKPTSTPNVSSQCPVCKEHDYAKVSKYGLCTKCADKYHIIIEDAALQQGKDRYTLTVHKEGTNICPCGDTKCKGIYLATCDHVVHGQGFPNDICDHCFKLGNQHMHTQHLGGAMG